MNNELTLNKVETGLIITESDVNELMGKNYKTDIKRFNDWHFNNEIPVSIESIREFHASLKLLSTSVRRKQISALRKMVQKILRFPELSRDEVLQLMNLLDSMKLPKQKIMIKDQTREKFLTEDQIRYLIANTDAKTSALISLLAETGLRIGAVLSIITANCTISGNIVYITGVEKGGKIFNTQIPITIYNRIIEAYGPCDTYLLHNKLSELNYINTYRWVRNASKRLLGIDKLGPHIIRHSFCTIQLANGASLQDVSNEVNHSTMDTTKNYYIHTKSTIKRIFD